MHVEIELQCEEAEPRTGLLCGRNNIKDTTHHWQVLLHSHRADMARANETNHMHLNASRARAVKMIYMARLHAIHTKKVRGLAHVVCINGSIVLRLRSDC